MIQSLEASLRRLKTDRVDMLWAHAPDNATPIEEILRAFDDLVRAGKILYAGLSNFPAWRVATGATIASLRGWSPLAAIQIEYSLVERAADRDLLPMADAFGLGVVGYSPLGGGLLTGKYRRGDTGRAQSMISKFLHREEDGNKGAILDAVESVARETSVTPEQVAISWVMSKGIIPIVGPRNPEQLGPNLAAANLALNEDQSKRLDAISAIKLGFPHHLREDPDALNAIAGGKGALLDQPDRCVA